MQDFQIAEQKKPAICITGFFKIIYKFLFRLNQFDFWRSLFF
jgi:hypothetical protein